MSTRAPFSPEMHAAPPAGPPEAGPRVGSAGSQIGRYVLDKIRYFLFSSLRFAGSFYRLREPKQTPYYSIPKLLWSIMARTGVKDMIQLVRLRSKIFSKNGPPCTSLLVSSILVIRTAIFGISTHQSARSLTNSISRAEEAKNMYDSETHQQTRTCSCTGTSRSAATFTGSILNNFHGVGVPVCVVNQLSIIFCTPTFACRSAVSVYEMVQVLSSRRPW